VGQGSVAFPLVSSVVELYGAGRRRGKLRLTRWGHGVNNGAVAELLATHVQAGYCTWGKLGN
jgi:hypothetical protein